MYKFHLRVYVNLLIKDRLNEVISNIYFFMQQFLPTYRRDITVGVCSQLLAEPGWSKRFSVEGEFSLFIGEMIVVGKTKSMHTGI